MSGRMREGWIESERRRREMSMRENEGRERGEEIEHRREMKHVLEDSYSTYNISVMSSFCCTGNVFSNYCVC